MKRLLLRVSHNEKRLIRVVESRIRTLALRSNFIDSMAEVRQLTRFLLKEFLTWNEEIVVKSKLQ